MTFDENRPKQQGKGKILFDYILLAPAIQFAKHYLSPSRLIALRCRVPTQCHTVLHATYCFVIGISVLILFIYS